LIGDCGIAGPLMMREQEEAPRRATGARGEDGTAGAVAAWTERTSGDMEEAGAGTGVTSGGRPGEAGSGSMGEKPIIGGVASLAPSGDASAARCG